MKIGWVRGSERISFHRPNTWFCLGVRGSGKSSLLEHIGEGYLSKQHKILDLFGSRDGEGLCWCRSPYAKDKKILLIHGDNVDVKASFDTRNISKFRLSDLEFYDIIISASPLYSSPDDEFLHINKLIDTLYKRMSWSKLIYTLIRESANLYYSRLRVSDNQLVAKAESVYLLREARHMGISMALDTQKFTSVDLDIRSLIDYLFFKQQGILGFPKDLEWLYGFFEPHVVRSMRQQHFIVVSRRGPLGLGVFSELPWHKKERENIVDAVGIKIERGEELDYGENRGAFKTVSDQEHVEIISLYTQGLGMHKIATKLSRSSGTIHGQVHSHNQAIDRMGYCMRCQRAKGEKAQEKA